MSRQFENILNECLERMLLRGETIEQCLQSYPEHASELEPLLRVALASSSLRDIRPRPEFKARARYQFLAALEEATNKKSRFSLFWLPRWATVVALVLVFVITASGTVAAAGHSMPDSPLYPVKTTVEAIQLGLTPSKEAKAELNMAQANERVAEIIYMASRGEARKVEELTERLNTRLEKLAALVGPDTGPAKAPMLATAPSPTPEPPMAAAQAPTPTVPVPTPAPEPVQPPRISSEDGKGNAPKQGSEDSTKKSPSKIDSERLKLKMEVARYAALHPAALRKLLEEVPESSRPALRQAIMVLIEGYGKTLQALEQARETPSP